MFTQFFMFNIEQKKTKIFQDFFIFLLQNIIYLHYNICYIQNDNNHHMKIIFMHSRQFSLILNCHSMILTASERYIKCCVCVVHTAILLRQNFKIDNGNLLKDVLNFIVANISYIQGNFYFYFNNFELKKYIYI